MMRNFLNTRIHSLNRIRKLSTIYSLSHRIILLAILGITIASAAQAEQLAFSFTDPVGDHTGTIDVTGMSCVFDNATGDYTIALTATAANPFVGQFRININLFNPDTTSSNSFFSDTINDFNLATATTSMILTGTSFSLLAWNAGDRVATNTFAFGNPPGTGISFFRSSVSSPPLGGFNEDVIAFGAEGFTTIAVLSPQGAIELLSSDVEALVDEGILSQDQADGLIDKIEAAIDSLNRGNTRAACNQLRSFINQVNAFIRARKLSPEEGQEVIDTAEDVRDQIGC